MQHVVEVCGSESRLSGSGNANEGCRWLRGEGGGGGSGHLGSQLSRRYQPQLWAKCATTIARNGVERPNASHCARGMHRPPPPASAAPAASPAAAPGAAPLICVWMNLSSSALIRGCCSGVDAASRYHATHHTMPIAPNR
eukprot:COSAG04_NODE_1793_length_5565_cov_52.214782_7_plen_140_part_00